MHDFLIGDKAIHKGSLPYVIAEVGVNHEGSIPVAIDLIRSAKRAGADAVKFQTYKASKLASVNSPAYWDQTKETTSSQHELFSKYDNFEEQDYIMLANVCKEEGIDFVSTPFDLEAVDFLEPLMPCFKIASADINNVPLLRRIARHGKPVIMSTGASTLEEIRFAVQTLADGGCCDIALLHCILNYPTEDENAHLGMIKGLAEEFPDCIIGYSDHTMPDAAMTTLSASYVLGALIIEKHFTHDKTLQGNDHYHAMNESDLQIFVEQARKLHALLGASEHKEPLKSEEISIQNARRSLVAATDIPAGTVLNEENLICKRPGTGISVSCWDEVIGMVAARDIQTDTVLAWEDVKR